MAGCTPSRRRCATILYDARTVEEATDLLLAADRP
jgi:hypothetical protein